MKNEYEKISQTVTRLKSDYNFRGLFHYTDFSNLNSIIKYGYLYGRIYCDEHNIDYYDSADEDLINNISKEVKSCARFYYKQNLMPNLPIPVYLIFSEELLYFENTYFADGCADSTFTRYGRDFDFFNYEMEWNLIFDNTPIPKEYYTSVKKSIDRKRHAELLSSEPVSLKYIKNVIFRCNTDYKRACNLFGKSKLFLVEPDIFCTDSNYIKDYSIVYDNSKKKEVFILHFTTNWPVKNHEEHKYCLYDLNDNLLQSINVKYSESSTTDFNLEVINLPIFPIKFKFYFYGVLSIEEVIG